MLDRILNYVTDGAHNNKETTEQERELSDYAIMISGEWGVGKTYFINHTLKKGLESEGMRMVYVSLIGVDSDETLSKKIFSQINPFYNSSKSEIAKEAEHMERLVRIGKKEKSIPEDVVLVMDDLERIHPGYFEAAMGYLNVFVEHENTKCIFVSNEDSLKERFTSQLEKILDDGLNRISSSIREEENAAKLNSEITSTNSNYYKKIKEKYIRFTYYFKPILEDVINDLLKEKHQSLDKDEVLSIFQKRDNKNIRIFLHCKSIFTQVLDEIKKHKIQLDENRNEILQLIFNYICFYSIEHKGGVPHEVLNSITIRISEVDMSGMFNQDLSGFQIDDSEENDGDGYDEVASEDKTETKAQEIRKIYFNDSSFQFQYFESIADLIANGTIDKEKLRYDIEKAIKDNENKALKEREKRIRNIFYLNDDKYVNEIKALIKHAENGELNLESYLGLFNVLLWLTKYKLDGLEDFDIINEKLRNGLGLAITNGNCSHISNLDTQISRITDAEPMHDIYNSFRDFILEKNNSLLEDNKKKKIEKLITSINNKEKDAIHHLLVEDDNLVLNENHAEEICNVLIESQSEIIIQFSKSLEARYRRGIHTISPRIPKYEMAFTQKLYELLNKNPNIKPNHKKTMSQVRLSFFTWYLKLIIDESKK